MNQLTIEPGYLAGLKQKSWSLFLGGKLIAGARINFFAADKPGFLLKSHASWRSQINAVVVYKAIDLFNTSDSFRSNRGSQTLDGYRDDYFFNL
jgi:hypothetical protein